MTRIPRKLKKGCNTLHGEPRTKWQRRGQLLMGRSLVDMGWNFFKMIATHHLPTPTHVLPSGGFFTSNNPCSQNEMVINKDQIQRLKAKVTISKEEFEKCKDGFELMEFIAGKALSEEMKRIKEANPC